jgi:hypothetical protein
MYTNHKNTPDYWYTNKSTGPQSSPFNFLPCQPSKTLRRKHFPDEAPPQPNELADAYYRYYRPANSAERDRVDSMVENEWQLREFELDLPEPDADAFFG